MSVTKISASDITTVLPAFYAAGRVPYFVGKPGIAKTAMVRRGAQVLSQIYRDPGTGIPACVPVIELHLASMSEVDIRGYLIPVGNESTFTAPSFWRQVQQSPRGIVFLDEFPQASHEVQKACAPLILEGCIGEFKLPPGWRVVLAGNGTEDNSGANTILAHVLNRVFRIEVSPPDVDQWVGWAIEEQLEPEIIAFAKLRPNVVFDSAVPDAPDTPWCTPRSAHAVSDVAKYYPGGIRAMAASQLGLSVMAGAIGPGAAGELAAVVKTSLNLPSMEEILRDPEGARLPTELSEQYAAIMLVAVRADYAKHADAPVRYLVRFQANMALTALVTLINRDKNFAMSAAIQQWVQTNKELLAKFHKYIQIRGG